MSDNEWPPILTVGTRVEVDLAALDVHRTVRGTIRAVQDDTGHEDPSYFIELDAQTQHSVQGELTWGEVQKLKEDLGYDESLNKRWITWEFVRPLSVLELLAENV